jgi:Spy/CpxP family protein refolding chaperone
MQGSKNLAVMFLLGAVLVGGALGFTADRVMLRDQICPARSGSGGARQKFAERLGLTPEQEAKVDSLLDARHRQDQAVMATIRAQRDSIREQSRAQIRLILNDEQKQRFQALLAELNDNQKSRDRDR